MSPISMTINFNSVEEAAAFFAGRTPTAVEQPAPAAAQAPATEEKPAAPKSGGKKSPPKTEPAAAAQTQADPVASPSGATPPSEAKAAAAPAGKALTYKEDVLPALMAISKVVPREKFAALLAKVGVVKVPELEAKPDLFAEIVAAVATAETLDAYLA